MAPGFERLRQTPWCRPKVQCSCQRAYLLKLWGRSKDCPRFRTYLPRMEKRCELSICCSELLSFHKVYVISDAGPPAVSLFQTALYIERKMSSQVRDRDQLRGLFSFLVLSFVWSVSVEVIYILWNAVVIAYFMHTRGECVLSCKLRRNRCLLVLLRHTEIFLYAMQDYYRDQKHYFLSVYILIKHQFRFIACVICYDGKL